MSDFSGIYAWVRELLLSDETKLPDAKLLLYATSEVDRLVDLYPGVSYDSLSGADATFFDEGVGHLIAIRMRPARPKAVPISDLLRVHTQNTHFQFAEAGKAGQVPLEIQWLVAARKALIRVAAIGAVIAARAEAFSPFVVSGPTRASIAAGESQSLMTTLIRLLSEDAAEDLASGVAQD